METTVSKNGHVRADHEIFKVTKLKALHCTQLHVQMRHQYEVTPY